MNTRLFILSLSLASVSFAQTPQSPPASSLPKETLADTLKRTAKPAPTRVQNAPQATPTALTAPAALTVPAPTPPVAEPAMTVSQATDDGEKKCDSDMGCSMKRHGGMYGDGSRSLNFGVGYVYSRWDKISSDLRKGGVQYSISGTREWSPEFEGGIGFTMLTGARDDRADENLYAAQIDVLARYYIVPGSVRPYLGLGMSVGGFRAWSLESETWQTVTYRKHASGALLGFTPELGLKLKFGGQMALNLAARYIAYVDNPNYKVGGWGAGLGLSFSH